MEKINWDKVTALCSVVIASLSMYVSYMQGEASREHNRLTVRPMLQLEINVDPDTGGYNAYVNNNGLGPAIVKNVIFRLNGKKIERDALLVKLGFKLECFGRGNVKRTFKPADRQMLFYLMNDAHKECAIRQKDLPEKFGKVSMEVDYESLYGEQIKLLKSLY